MSLTLTATYITEKNKVDSIAPLRLFEIEYGDVAASKVYYAAWNKDIDYFQPNTATAQTYTAIPIDINDIEYNDVETSPRVILNISAADEDRTIISYLENYDGLRGRPVTIIRTFESLLSDPNACIVEKYYIDSAQADVNNAAFTLVPKTVLEGVSVPLRRYRRNQCQWQFKGLECIGSSNVNATTANSATLASPSFTTCSKTLASCEWYNNASKNTYRYGGFPGIPQRKVFY